MKHLIAYLTICTALVLTTGCLNKGRHANENGEEPDTSTVADTGFTGIKQFYSRSHLTYEATYKNGVRQGLMKTYNIDGKLYQTFWYENNLREDTAVWYYPDGRPFRKTPFKNDTMNGTQIQYYRTGKVRAKLKFEKGLRIPYLEEFSSDGKKINSYPELVVKTRDDYRKDGTYSIFLELNKSGVKANYYKGQYINGLFDPKKLTKINSSDTKGFIKLKKTANQESDHVNVIVEIFTPLGNKYLVDKRIALPYNDLK
jgi:antitoxin component YwqK of YwqJK toxin-antitoxin module